MFPEASFRSSPVASRRKSPLDRSMKDGGATRQAARASDASGLDSKQTSSRVSLDERGPTVRVVATRRRGRRTVVPRCPWVSPCMVAMYGRLLRTAASAPARETMCHRMCGQDDIRTIVPTVSGGGVVASAEGPRPCLDPSRGTTLRAMPGDTGRAKPTQAGHTGGRDGRRRGTGRHRSAENARSAARRRGSARPPRFATSNGRPVVLHHPRGDPGPAGATQAGESSRNRWGAGLPGSFPKP